VLPLQRLALCAIVISCAASAGRADAVSREAASVERKLDLIESGRLRPGSRIDFAQGELNAWLGEQAKAYFPGAVRNIRVSLGANSAAGYADVDFVKMRQAATGESPGWIMRNLFSGERPIVVQAHLVSANGGARVDLDSVRISGVSIEGRALDFLIRNYVRPTFPDLKLGEWFRLANSINRIAITPSRAMVFMGRRPGDSREVEGPHRLLRVIPDFPAKKLEKISFDSFPYAPRRSDIVHQGLRITPTERGRRTAARRSLAMHPRRASLAPANDAFAVDISEW